MNVLPIVKWHNALFCSGKQGPSPTVRSTLMTMSIRADNNSLKFFISIDNIAEWLGVSKRTAERRVADALESGWLTQVKRGRTGIASDYMLTFGATDNPTGIIPNPSKVSGSNPTEMSDLPVRNVGPTTPQHTPITTPIDIPSLQADEERKTANAVHRETTNIPETWHVSGSHTSYAMRVGISPVKTLGETFKNWATDNGIRSSDWDKKFGSLLHCIEERYSPEDRGFDGIHEYIGESYV